MHLPAFFKSPSAGGIVLIACVMLALLIANSPLAKGFEQLLATPVSLASVQLSILNWINDGLMAVFFFLVGLEIKQEMTSGHLSGFKKAAVPVVAAVGGAIIPAVIFLLLNDGKASAGGWGIPMATDIAFALGVLSLLGKVVPGSFRAFLSALAVVDDLLAIMVIAIFYTSNLHWAYLLAGLGIWLLLLGLNKWGVKRPVYYILPGLLMWYCIHHSGIHATVAGVLTALAIPAKAKRGNQLNHLVHHLHVPVNFIIMPLFAIANTNIHLEQGMLQALFSPLGLGIIAGLVLGKPIGIVLASWLSVKLRIGYLPQGMRWVHVACMGVLAGIGFTIAIFMSFLSFGSSHLNSDAKFSVLLASLIAGVAGYALLGLSLKKNHP